MNGDARHHAGPLPRPDTARRAKAEGRPIAIQAALDAFEDGDTDTYLLFLLGEATPAEVEKHVSAFTRATALTATEFLRQYREQVPEFIASALDPVSPTSPPPKGDGEDGERTSGGAPNECKSSFGGNGESGDTQSISRITLTPFYELAAPPLPPDAYLFGNLLVRGAATLLSGAPGSGKSTFAYFIAAGLARNGSVLGHGPGEPIPVAYFDAESSDSLAREKAMLASAGDEARGLMKLSDNAFSNDDELVALMEAHRIQLLIIDTLNRALPIEKDNDSRDARERIVRLKRIAREANVAALAIGHQPKMRHAAAVHNVLGSVETAAGVDVIILARSCGLKERFLELQVAKNRLGTVPTSNLRLLKIGNGAFDLVETMSAPAPTKKNTLADAIERQARANGTITRKQALAIADKAGSKRNTADRALTQLIEAHILRRSERGVFTVVNGGIADE